MAEEGAPTSIAARIAALNLGQVGRQPNSPPPTYEQVVAAPPSLPPRRPQPLARNQTTNVPPTATHVSAASVGHDIGNLPADERTSQCTGTPPLPPRRPSEQKPQLPPRQPSGTPSSLSRKPSGYGLDRRASIESTSSALSFVSAISANTAASSRTSASLPGQTYQIRAPVYDPSTLPPLPLKKGKEHPPAPGRTPLKTARSTPTVPVKTTLDVPAKTTPSSELPGNCSQRTPPLPSRQPSLQALPPPKPQAPRRDARSFALNKSNEVAPALPASRPGLQPTRSEGGVPPPIPTSSRPDLSKLLASKPTLSSRPTTSQPNDTASCLRCRDFSAADAHAARFPREAIPSTDLSWLAHQLTFPFPSATDKARAIFTWLHHNINYDTVAFFGNNIKPSTPASTIASGLAVCEGYAGLFAALGVKAGLEAIVVSGHGKGAGYQDPKPGQPLPGFKASHAWNAVRIDDGEWKLIDPCWGAGCLMNGQTSYTRRFEPRMFTMDNDEFGRRHYPTDKTMFFRNDGRAGISWEEYLLNAGVGEGPQLYNVGGEGFGELSFTPRGKRVSTRDDSRPYIRFQFSKVCEHWDPVKNGKGKWYLYVLVVQGVDGRQERKIPFDSNGMFWWCDVQPRELGAPGQKVKVMAMTSFDGRDGRGLSVMEYREKDGRCGWAGSFLAEWDIVD